MLTQIFCLTILLSAACSDTLIATRPTSINEGMYITIHDFLENFENTIGTYLQTYNTSSTNILRLWGDLIGDTVATLLVGPNNIVKFITKLLPKPLQVWPNKTEICWDRNISPKTITYLTESIGDCFSKNAIYDVWVDILQLVVDLRQHVETWPLLSTKLIDLIPNIFNELDFLVGLIIKNVFRGVGAALILAVPKAVVCSGLQILKEFNQKSQEFSNFTKCVSG